LLQAQGQRKAQASAFDNPSVLGAAAVRIHSAKLFLVSSALLS
jgi:hypothetical protein